MAPFFHKTPGRGTMVTTDCRLRLEIPKNIIVIYSDILVVMNGGGSVNELEGNHKAHCAITVSYM